MISKRRLRTLLVRSGYHSKPKVLIIGTQKGGTSALHDYLSKHPDVVPPSRKEICYFCSESFQYLTHYIPPICPPDWKELDFFHPTTLTRGRDWYHDHFPLPYRLTGRKLTYDSTPAYMYYSASPERIRIYDPSIKLIVLLRNPVSRAYSAWNMYRNFNSHETYHYLHDSRTFSDAILEEMDEYDSPNSQWHPGYVRRGVYFEQLERYYKVFSPDQIMVLDSRTLHHNPVRVLEDVCDFVGIRRNVVHSLNLKPQHVGEYKNPIDPRVERLLRDFYKQHNARLYDLLGYDMKW